MAELVSTWRSRSRHLSHLPQVYHLPATSTENLPQEPGLSDLNRDWRQTDKALCLFSENVTPAIENVKYSWFSGRTQSGQHLITLRLMNTTNVAKSDT